MAILKGIEVTIRVNGHALQEYDDSFEVGDQNSSNQDDHDGMPHRVSKHIEATSGARFAINVVVPKSAKALLGALSFKLSLDGHPVQSHDMFMALMPLELKHGIWSHSKDGSTKMTSIETVKRPFMFSDIKWSGDQSTPAQVRQKKRSAEDLGTIVVKILRVKKLDRVRRKNDPTSFEGPLNGAEKLNEKEVKGKNVTHSVCLGSVEQGYSSSWAWRTRYVDDLDCPFAIFTFNYCSKKALQSLLLVPRTPSPAPAPIAVPLEERPEDELTMEELRELARRQRARFQVERKATVKSEAEVKAENGTKRARDEEVEELVVSSLAKKVKGPFANGEVVDLSD